MASGEIWRRAQEADTGTDCASSSRAVRNRSARPVLPVLVEFGCQGGITMVGQRSRELALIDAAQG